MQRDAAGLEALKAEVRELQGDVKEREGQVAALRSTSAGPRWAPSCTLATRHCACVPIVLKSRMQVTSHSGCKLRQTTDVCVRRHLRDSSCSDMQDNSCSDKSSSCAGASSARSSRRWWRRRRR